jgi:Flp pilus assembly protein protease CpaA
MSILTFTGFILLIAVYIDLKKRIIPNWILSVGFVGITVLHLVVHAYEWPKFTLAAIAWFLLMWVFAILSKGSIGGGDVKLFAFMGYSLGFMPTLWLFILSHLIGGLCVLLMWGVRRIKKGDMLPFAPFLLIIFCIFYTI